MTIAELLYSLNCAGLSLGLSPGDTLEVKGQVDKLTPEQRQALSEHKSTLIGLLNTPTCLTFEEQEREAIQFADTPEAQGLADETDIFDLAIGGQGSYTWHTELWNLIGSKDELRELDALEKLFGKMLSYSGNDTTLETEIRELTANRRALLVERERHNQKANGPGADTPNPL